MEINQKKVVIDWMRKIHTLEYGHRFQSLRWTRINFWLGFPSLILATVIGTVSAIPNENHCIPKEFIASLGGIIVAILTGLQTFLKPTESAEKHRASSSGLTV